MMSPTSRDIFLLLAQYAGRSIAMELYLKRRQLEDPTITLPKNFVTGFEGDTTAEAAFLRGLHDCLEKLGQKL